MSRNKFLFFYTVFDYIVKLWYSMVYLSEALPLRSVLLYRQISKLKYFSSSVKDSASKNFFEEVNFGLLTPTQLCYTSVDGLVKKKVKNKCIQTN